MIKKFGVGKFYSVSVGAGGYEYLTLKAKRIIETADIIAVPIKKVGEQSTALGIIGELADGKDIMKVLFPMAENKEIRKVHRLHSAELIAEKLNENQISNFNILWRLMSRSDEKSPLLIKNANTPKNIQERMMKLQILGRSC